MQVHKYASIQVCKHAIWKEYMQLSKNKGMYDVCMQLCEYVDIDIEVSTLKIRKYGIIMDKSI